MGNLSYGLRFDIYDRVRLQEHMAGIQQLEEIELTPHIQVIPQETQAVLKGHLLLSGVYVGTGEQRSTHELEHLIPVEITLPMNRVHRIDDIAVNIDTFDVEVLSERNLNVTGVLSLHGIVTTPVNDTPAWDNGEITVVHQNNRPDEGAAGEPDRLDTSVDAGDVRGDGSGSAGDADLSDAEADAPADDAGNSAETAEAEASAATYRASGNSEDRSADEAEPSEAEVRVSASEQADDPPADTDHRSSAPGTMDEAEPIEAAAENRRSAAVSADAPSPWTLDKHSSEQSTAVQEESAEDSSSGVSAQTLADLAAPAEEASFTPELDEHRQEAEPVPTEAAQDSLKADKEDELKIAFGRLEEEQRGKIGVSALLRTKSDPDHSLRGEPAADKRSLQEPEPDIAASAPARSGSTGDELDWKSLFLSASGGEREFKRVRICIVQKEETLEMIADRYQLNPREIMLYNRLEGQELMEGQVIYIPKT
jgi:stage VI sporulation protein D